MCSSIADVYNDYTHMDTHNSDEHKDTLYSIIALFLMFISIIVGGVFYMRTKDMKAPAPTSQSNEKAPDKKIEPVPTRPFDDVHEDSSVLKIAIPNDLKGVLTDEQNRKTGLFEDLSISNDIPFSEFAPDKTVGTVSWIVVEKPASGIYTLSITGTSDKAVALYLKNNLGNESLELVDVDIYKEQGHTYTITIDPSARVKALSIQEQ